MKMTTNKNKQKNTFNVGCLVITIFIYYASNSQLRVAPKDADQNDCSRENAPLPCQLAVLASPQHFVTREIPHLAPH